MNNINNVGNRGGFVDRIYSFFQKIGKKNRSFTSRETSATSVNEKASIAASMSNKAAVKSRSVHAIPFDHNKGPQRFGVGPGIPTGSVFGRSTNLNAQKVHDYLEKLGYSEPYTALLQKKIKETTIKAGETLEKTLDRVNEEYKKERLAQLSDFFDDLDGTSLQVFKILLEEKDLPAYDPLEYDLPSLPLDDKTEEKRLKIMELMQRVPDEPAMKRVLWNYNTSSGASKNMERLLSEFRFNT